MTSPLVVTNLRTAATLETYIDVDSLRLQDSGSKEAASVNFDLEDLALTFDLQPEDEITLSAVGSPSDLMFGGFVRGLDTNVTTRGRVYSVTAYDYSTLLDRINVVQDDRVAGESDADRLAYFMTTYGSGLLDDDPAGIATLNGSMPAQKFRLITLRQAIEQVLGSALVTGNYRITAYKKLQTWDADPGLTAAPYDIILGTPGAGQVVPESISIKADTSNLYNAYWVRGATAAGSGWFTNATSIAAWGRREKYIDAPDSDLYWKASNVGLAALADTKDPKYRGMMTVRAGDWRSDQRFALTSAPHGLSAAPFDTVRVSRSYLTPAGLEVMDVEFGSPKGSFAAKHGKQSRRSDGVGGFGGGAGGGYGGGGYVPGGTGGGGGVGTDHCGCGPFTGGDCVGTTIDDFSNRTIHVTGPFANASTPMGASSGGWGSWVHEALGGGNAGDVIDVNPSTQILTNTFQHRVGAGAISSWRNRLPKPASGTAAPWDNPIHSWSVRFQFDHVETSGSFSHGVQIDAGNASLTIAVNSAAGSLTLASDIDTATLARTSWTTGVWYRADIDVNFPGALVRARVYLDGDPVPGWELAAGAGTFTEATGVPFLWLGGANTDPATDFTVQFQLDPVTQCSVPATGQPVQGTHTGDGTTTAYTTGHPFLATSLIVLVNGTDVTSDITETDPTTGAYSFIHAPLSGANIRERFLAL